MWPNSIWTRSVLSGRRAFLEKATAGILGVPLRTALASREPAGMAAWPTTAVQPCPPMLLMKLENSGSHRLSGYVCGEPLPMDEQS